MKYRKKPVVIEAEQFCPEQMDWPQGVETASEKQVEDYGWSFVINTLEGPHVVTAGDWIITGVKGERYPCKPDIFDATYEPVVARKVGE